MYKNTAKHKHSRHDDYDLYGDLLKIRDAFSETAKDVRGKTSQTISESFENMKDKSLDLQDNMANYTREKPFKSLGFAMLAGVVIGYLIHKK